MENIRQDSRQIPKHSDYIGNKEYHDRIYGYLQERSQIDWKQGMKSQQGNFRYVLKKNVSYVKIAEDLGITRQTVSKWFKKMLEGTEENKKAGFPPLVREKKDRYQLLFIEDRQAMLIPTPTLRVLVSIFNDKVISVYAYLYNRWYASQQSSFQFTYEQIKKAVGMGYMSRSNNPEIQLILKVLQNVGLIKWRQVIRDDGSGHNTDNFITQVNLDIDVLPPERIFVDQKKQQKTRQIFNLLNAC